MNQDRTTNKGPRTKNRPRESICTLRVCGRKKLPFAGYSVDKDHKRFGPWPGASAVARGAPMPRSAPSRVVVAVTDSRRLLRASRCRRGVTIGDCQRAWN
jgi:hypothetical protein